jgi:DUF971 family protein/molybdopterin converting factor small subunit
MMKPATPLVPTGIKLHRKSRLLEISFPDDTQFILPCEYLRVFATTGEGTIPPLHGKQRVEITNLEPQGAGALLLEFDDGYSGSYSWEALHALGVDYERNWEAYLQALAAHGLERGADRALGADGKVTVKVLYFIQLAKLTGRNEEAVELPDAVTNVETLLDWLGQRRQGWEEAFAIDKVQVTVNKHFAEPYTLIENGDEVALVPRAI